MSCVPLHGRMQQRNRTLALADFRSGKARCLVATEVASRGLDIKKLWCVCICLCVCACVRSFLLLAIRASVGLVDSIREVRALLFCGVLMLVE